MLKKIPARAEYNQAKCGQDMNCTTCKSLLAASYSCSNSGISYKDVNSWYHQLLLLQSERECVTFRCSTWASCM